MGSVVKVPVELISVLDVKKVEHQTQRSTVMPIKGSALFHIIYSANFIPWPHNTFSSCVLFSF